MLLAEPFTKIIKTKNQVSVVIENDDRYTTLTSPKEGFSVIIDQKTEWGDIQTITLTITDLEDALTLLHMEKE